MKRVTLIALSAIFALGLAACDRPGSTDSAKRSSDQNKSAANKPAPANPNPPTGTPPASKP